MILREVERERQDAETLNDNRPDGDIACDTDNSAYTGYVERLTHEDALAQSNPLSEQHEQQDRAGHEAKSAKLYEHENHNVAERRPVFPRIDHHQACNAHCRRSSEKGIDEGCCIAGLCRSGQHEKERTQCDKDCKTTRKDEGCPKPASSLVPLGIGRRRHEDHFGRALALSRLSAVSFVRGSDV